MYNIKQAKRDIDAVYSMGLFDDVNILPSPSEDSSMENPKVRRHQEHCTFIASMKLRSQSRSRRGKQRLHAETTQCA